MTSYRQVTRSSQCHACESIACLLIIVEDDNHVLVQEACMIHGLVRHAPCDGSIPNHCHAMIFPALHSTTSTESQDCLTLTSSRYHALGIPE